VVQTAKEMHQIMRAINYGNSLQDFILIYFCKLEEMFLVSQALECIADNVETAVCGITPLCQG